MTKKQALQLLIEHAAENVAGVGVGLRSTPSDTVKVLVREAIEKLFPDAHGREMDRNDFFNMRLKH